jgi:glycosyltransferase 2 family protein
LTDSIRNDNTGTPKSNSIKRKRPAVRAIRILFGLAISALFIWLIYTRIEVDKVTEAIRAVQVWWLIPAIVIYILGVWVRTARWSVLMNCVKKCSTNRLFPIYMISYMANNILPLRMGDIYRAYFVGRKESISKGATLVTIGVERIFDGLTMLLLLAGSLLFYPVNNPEVKLAIQIGSIVFLGSIIICYLVVLNRSWSDWIFSKFLALAPEKYHSRLHDIFDNLFHGLDSLKGKRELAGIVVLSLLTWLVEAVSYMVTLWAFGFFGGFHVSVSTMALVNLMIIVPAGPGYFGPFEAACIIMLGASGYGNVTHFTKEISTAYALILHIVVQWIPSTFLGLFYMWKEHVGFKQVENGRI